MYLTHRHKDWASKNFFSPPVFVAPSFAITNSPFCETCLTYRLKQTCLAKRKWEFHPLPLSSYEIDSRGCFCMWRCTNWWAMHFGTLLCSDLLSPFSLPSSFFNLSRKGEEKAPPVLFPAKTVLKSPLDSVGALEVIANWQKKGPNCFEGAGKCRVCFWKGLGRRCPVSLSSCCWRTLEITSALEKRSWKKKFNFTESEWVRESLWRFPFSLSKDLTILSLSI